MLREEAVEPATLGLLKKLISQAKLLQLYPLDDLLNFYQKRHPYDDTFAVMPLLFILITRKKTLIRQPSRKRPGMMLKKL